MESALQDATDDAGSFSVPRRRSADLYQRATGSLVSGVNHNLRYSPPFPLYFERGEGPLKWDADGNEYVDYQLGSAALLLGHRADLAEAAAVSGIPSAPHENEIVWGELVTSIVP